jgi:hypothetical protein
MQSDVFTVVTLQLRTDDPATWRRADEVIHLITAVPGVTSVVATKRCERYLDLDLAVRLQSTSKAGLRRLYDEVSRLAGKSPFRLAGRDCVLNDMF